MKKYLIYLKNIITLEGKENLNLSFLAIVSNCKSPEEAREQFLVNNDEESLKDIMGILNEHPSNALLITDEDSEIAKETLPSIIEYLQEAVKEEESPKDDIEGMLKELEEIAEKLNK